MAANNQIVIIGRAGGAAKESLRYLQSGAVICEINLAVTRPGKDSMGNVQTDWVKCQFWNKQAETVGEYISKGDLLSISGSLRTETWDDKDTGKKRTKFFILAENFQMLESRSAKENRNQAAATSGYGSGGSGGTSRGYGAGGGGPMSQQSYGGGATGGSIEAQESSEKAITASHQSMTPGLPPVPPSPVQQALDGLGSDNDYLEDEYPPF
jgi:single-strand DNA-binding protein